MACKGDNQRSKTRLSLIFFFFILMQMPSAGLKAAAMQSGSNLSADVKAVPVYKAFEQSQIAESGSETPESENHSGLSLTTFVNDHFIGSGRCSTCHDLLVDAAGNDMSIVNHWRSTMMANAARDPFWQAKVSSEISRHPEISQVIESKCATCHMPMAWTEQNADKYTKKDKSAYANNGDVIFGNGYLNRKSPYHNAAMDGVSCSLCHQIRNENLGEKKSFSGKYIIDTDTPPPDRKIFGPYHDVQQKAMRTSIEYTPVFGSHINDSALCAICHTLYTPYLDNQGKIAGEFPEQTAFLEWRHSNYFVPKEKSREIGDKGPGKICQDCHMPHSPAGEVYIAKWTPREINPRDHFSQHHFVGGNVQMLNILLDNIAELDLTSSTEKLEDTKKRTLDQLQSQSAAIAVTGSSHFFNTLNVDLAIDNMVGHKFPTGFPSRKLWLHVKATDGNGDVFFESGPPLENGTIGGNNNDLDPLTFEPHYTTVADQEQVQIYEAVMADVDDAVTYTLLRAAKYLKDNRLLPEGFNKLSVPDDIAVRGAAGQDPDFTGGSDHITYKIDTTGHPGPFHISVELLYSAFSHAFIADMNRDRHLPLVQRFIRMYEQTDKSPVRVAYTSFTVQ